MTDALKELARQLSSEDPYERESAVLELVELADPKAASLLVRALGDSAEPVRRWSAHGLAKLGRAEDVPALRRTMEKDPAPSVRIQAALGLARLGERPAIDRLIQFLKEPPLDARHDAAEALLSLQETAPLRPLLRPMLDTEDESSRAWAAGLLYALGDADAFLLWRGTLGSPESRRDAVGVAPFMREPGAIRELLRLLAELPQEELDATEGDEPSLAEHLANALRLSGMELLLGAEATEGLWSDLLALLGRHQHLVPELVDDLVQFLAQRPPADLGKDVAQLLSEQEPGERGAIFLAIATLLPEISIPTLVALEESVREEVLETVREALENTRGEDETLTALGETLSESPFGERFEGLAEASMTQEQEIPEEEEESGASVTREMPAVKVPSPATVTREMHAVEEPPASPTMEFELPEEFSEEEEEDEAWPATAPPEADVVAQRILAVGAMLRRLVLEERLARGKDPSAKEEIQRLQRWVDEEELFSPLGATGLELFEAEPGAWSEEDRQTVAWISEELQLLLWALKQGKLPPSEARVEAAPLLEKLPLLKEPQPFLDAAERRSLEEVEAQRDRWEVMLDCARYESFARGIQAEPSLAEGDPELERVLDSAENEGFDRSAVEAKHGPVRAAVEGLRFWGRFLVTELQKEGLLAGKPGEGLMFQGKRLAEMDEGTLALLLGLSHGRHAALGWLLEGEGDEGAPPEDEDEPG
ncbi:HEAT repeat domain-containing protein [Hyalangium rubrum]|uniref:HEAT repeat domain-containing protein n=1 Tax=Hyalangium rubrum TaxID=3103134 RepID=A0ABU5GWB7_9BACT|nr:HEAT repeat domain-containing protein [Hyalangium sp. s54d21]MDY7224984.1 HEAT repeat domain-containing protein [Hyalangium sp. s54d21]